MSGFLRRFVLRAIWTVHVAFVCAASQAHVPYLEEQDFTTSSSFVCPSAEQSIAVYAWLESAFDADYYKVRVTTPTLFYAGVIVPVIDLYADFRPNFALIGPGLPATTTSVPLRFEPSWGAVVLREDPQAARRSFYEPFGGKSYYQGPELTMELQPGEYTLVYWCPSGQTGDYVAIIGKREIWGAQDTVRALRVTPLIRRGEELHLNRKGR